MEKKEIQLLNRLYQDATVGTLAIDRILKKIDKDSNKQIFKKQYGMYEDFAEKCNAIAIENDVDIKENSPFKKMKQSVMLNFALMMDKSMRHIVELMINGTVMGIVDTIKIQKDLKTKNEQLNELVMEFRQMQEAFYEKLKALLMKV